MFGRTTPGKLKNKATEIITFFYWNMLTKIVDVHSHIQFPVFDSDREEVIGRAREAGVKMIAIGTQASTSKRAIEIAYKFPADVWATVGFHPSHIVVGRSDFGAGATKWHHDKNEQSESAPENFDIKILKKLAGDSKAVAIGECGFDLFRDNSIRKEQEKVFIEQAELARELNKPLMMHCRSSKGTDDAYEYALGVLKDSKYNFLTKIMHFYAGSFEITKRLMDLGFYFAFGGVITFSRGYDEIIKYLPLDRIFIETDCPYVAPQCHRGKRNEPAFISETAKKLAEIKGLDYEKASEELYGNSMRVFSLKSK